MSEEKGRGGFDLDHHRTIGDRAKLLREAMRELYDGASEEYAKIKPHLVLADEVKNKAYVNDGAGRLRRCTDPDDVLRYADERISRLYMKRKKDDYLFSTFILHLPKNYCTELKDFYEDTVTIEDEETGEKTTKKVKSSRWIAKDEKQAEKYFADAIQFLAEKVIPGGYDAILGIDIQYSETTPHVHVLTDPYEDDPKHLGKLRNSHGRAYGRHRDVTYMGKDKKGKPQRKQILGPVKMRKYHADFKEFMIARDWEIEAEVSDRSKEKLSQKDFVELQQRKALLEYQTEVAEKKIKRQKANFQFFADDVYAREDNVRAGELKLEAGQRELEAGQHELKNKNEELENKNAEIERKNDVVSKNLEASERDREEAAEILARLREGEDAMELLELFLQQAKAKGWNPEAIAKLENKKKVYKGALQYGSAAEVPNAFNGAETEEGVGLQFS